MQRYWWTYKNEKVLDRGIAKTFRGIDRRAMRVHRCGANLMYTYSKEDREACIREMGLIEVKNVAD